MMGDDAVSYTHLSISFYIFAYFCGESCRYTRHRRRYLRNLFAFALLSELPFQLLLDIIQGEPLLSLIHI